MDYKFLLRNIFFPRGKVSVHVGDSPTAINLLNYFNKRQWNRAFIKTKKFNISLLNLQKFESSKDYIASVNGKNSAAYFSRRCLKLGFEVSKFNPNLEIESIFAINTSMSERQGRQMDSSYSILQKEWPSGENHSWYGVYNADKQLVAYAWIYEVRELITVNRILGHGNYMKDNIMYLLLTEVVTTYIDQKRVKYMMYDTFGKHDNGLVLFKKRIGFEPYTVNFQR